jgi:hypothetical protein
MATKGRPTHNLCIGSPIPGKTKRAWTQVGVGWWDPEKDCMMVRINVRLLLEPIDTIYLFENKAGAEEREAMPDEEQF